MEKIIPVLFTLFFLTCGAILADRIFVRESWLIKGWAGVLWAMMGMMWAVIPFAFLFGFTPLAHSGAVILMAMIVVLVNRFVPPGLSVEKNRMEFSGILQATTGGIFCVLIALMFLHILYPKKDGLYAGPGTFGDLPLHLGIITSIVAQQKFPPEYSLFSGSRLGYPFLVDSLSSTFHLFGWSLRWSILLPSFLLAWVVVVGFVILAKEILGKTADTIIATVLFFFSGGLGFIYFLEGMPSHPENFTRLFTGFYFTPTNWYEKNIYMFNVLCHILVPQRTSLGGWAALFFILWLLHRSLTKEQNHFVLAGIMAGLLPMIHTHSFLNLMLIAATWSVVYFFPARYKKAYVTQWARFFILASILALPQLMIWTFPQTGKSFLHFHWNWENKNDNWLWFWIKNVGLVFIVMFPAILAAGKERLRFYSGAITLFIVGETVTFSMYPVNNNKIFYIWYAFTVILVAGYVMGIFEHMQGRRGRGILLGIFIFVSTFSGILTVAHDFLSSYELFSINDLKTAVFVKNHTPVDALFVTGNNHFQNNPVVALAGRRVFCGDPLYLTSHGIDIAERTQIVEQIYKQPEQFPLIQKQFDIDYLYLGGGERYYYQAQADYFDRYYPKIFAQNGVDIYAVSERAREHKEP